MRISIIDKGRSDENRMRFLFASDSFKGTITSERTINLLTEASRKIFPDCEVVGVPIADGGEGTVDAVIKVTNGTIRNCNVYDPLMENTTAYYGEMKDDFALIEMAMASGLPKVPQELRDPRNTSSYGTGELIKDALDRGYRKISIAIGGSATNDGGMGAMTALGIHFLDEHGKVLIGKGSDLIKVRDIDFSDIHPAIAETEFTVMCDVNNPLTGPTGATFTFGKQKGGTPEVLEELETGMKQYTSVIHKVTGMNVDQILGAGAAGGLGAALCVFLNAKLKSGIETVLDIIDFDKRLENVDVVITGEGRIDWQSAFGKVSSGIGNRCKQKGIPVISLVGGMGEGAEQIYEQGVDSIISTINGAMDINEALERAEELYINAAERMFRMLKVGMQINI
jgi:glycerate kinase